MKVVLATSHNGEVREQDCACSHGAHRHEFELGAGADGALLLGYVDRLARAWACVGVQAVQTWYKSRAAAPRGGVDVLLYARAEIEGGCVGARRCAAPQPHVTPCAAVPIATCTAAIDATTCLAPGCARQT